MYNSITFEELSFNELADIDGGRSIWRWIGDTCLVIGGVASLAAGPVAVGAWASAAYFYSQNVPD